MIETPEVILRQISVARGSGAESLEQLAEQAVSSFSGLPIKAVLVATFSNPNRFPALSVRLASRLNLPTSIVAFDIQMACSAYPYAIYLAGKLAADLDGEVLVVDGDVQTPLVDAADHATGGIFADAVTATLVSVNRSGTSCFDFRTRADEALTCSAAGPIHMNGFKVFSFVATEVISFLKCFSRDYDWFAPHQANPYMVRQLARSLGVESKLLTIDASEKNPGSCSVAMALARQPNPGRVLIAGFGAGYSAAAGIVTWVPTDFKVTH